MNRCLALLLAFLFASVSVASACTAASGELIRFNLEPAQRGGGAIKANFRDDSRPGHNSNWSSTFAPAELVGLDVAGFRSGGARPLRFAVIRDSGRLDCSGQGGNNYASGSCNMSLDPGFAQLLQNRGIARPSREEEFGLMALNVRRDLVDAVAAVHYPTPTINQLIEMTAVGVSGRYVTDLARAGYRPQSVHSLVEFRALGVTPEWIGGFARMGYANMPADELMQLKAMNISADYVAGFERLGYRHLPVNTLVQLKALDITPEFVRAAGVRPGATLPVDELVRRRIFVGRR